MAPVKLCASFHSHQWIRAGVTVRKFSIWIKIINFSSHVNLKFDRWPWKIIGYLFYATSSFVHCSVAICEFKLELESRNTRFGSICSFFGLCDLEIWWLTLKNDRAPLLCYYQVFCALFCSHLWIQTEATVQKQSMVDIQPMWPWNLTDDLEKQWGTSTPLYRFVVISELK